MKKFKSLFTKQLLKTFAIKAFTAYGFILIVYGLISLGIYLVSGPRTALNSMKNSVVRIHPAFRLGTFLIKRGSMARAILLDTMALCT